MKGISSAEAEGVSEKGPFPTSQPMKKKPNLPSFLLPSAKSHLPHTERSSAFEVCLGEKISLKCSPWRGHEFWDLLESPEKKKWLNSNTLFQDNWNINIVQK